MLPGVDPQQLAQARQIGKYIRGSIIVDYKDNTALLKLESSNPDAQRAIPSMLGSFTRALAEQMHMFFAVHGKIIERNKPHNVGQS